MGRGLRDAVDDHPLEVDEAAVGQDLADGLPPDLGHVDEGVRAGAQLVDVRARPRRQREPREEPAGDSRDVQDEHNLKAARAALPDDVLNDVAGALHQVQRRGVIYDLGLVDGS